MRFPWANGGNGPFLEAMPMCFFMDASVSFKTSGKVLGRGCITLDKRVSAAYAGRWD